MKKIFASILFVVLVLVGCQNGNKIAYLQIVGGGGINPMIQDVKIINNEIYTNYPGGARLYIEARDENNIKIPVEADWAAENGMIYPRTGQQTEFESSGMGIDRVTAVVGDITTTATIYTYGTIQNLMSGNNTIPNVSHLANFKIGYTDNIEEADVILLNEYYPNTPYYAETNRILFPNGFYPVEFESIRDLKDIPIIEEDAWVYELTNIQTGDFIKGIVRNIDNSFTKIQMYISTPTNHGVPDYLKASIIYNVTDNPLKFGF